MASKSYQNHAKRSGRTLTESGDFVNIADALLRGTTPFAEQITTKRVQQVVLNANIPISERRDLTTLVSGGTVTKVNAEYRVRASTTSGSIASLQSKQRGYYVSGNMHQCGLGIRIPNQPTGDAYIKWGYTKDNDGIYCLYNAQGLFLISESNGVELLRVKQNAWNVDTFANLDLAAGNVFDFNFVYYGYGAIALQISKEGDNNPFTFQEYAHTQRIDSNSSLFPDPNLPVSIEVSSGTTGVQLDAFVGGRQISSFGDALPAERSVSDARYLSSIATTDLPVISFRHRAGYENIAVRLAAIDLIPDADMFYEVRRNATLTGATFGTPTNYTADEVATEWDTAATAVTNGDTIYTGIISGSRSEQRLSAQDLPVRRLAENDTLTLTVRNRAGTGGNLFASFKVNELW